MTATANITSRIAATRMDIRHRHVYSLPNASAMRAAIESPPMLENFAAIGRSADGIAAAQYALCATPPVAIGEHVETLPGLQCGDDW